MLHDYFESSEISKRFFINAPIVQLNFGKIISSLDEAHGDVYERLMYRFEGYVDGHE